MLKVGLLCGVIAAMSATGVKASIDAKVESKPCDARFIIELKDDIDNLSAEQAIKQQENVFNKIKRSVNSNVILDRNFTILNNAFVIKANESDRDAIMGVSGVKEVTIDGKHVVKRTQSSKGFTISVNGEPGAGGEIDWSQNASAITMNKPDNTNDGEGTLIAVLDNEFYLKGLDKAYNANKEPDEPLSPYNHVTFTDLDESVKTRISDFASMQERAAKTHAFGKKISDTAGEEGSLYFNRKVPFYYDYAGDSYTGSSEGAVEDFNVESKIDLHGSHVASIAAGNDPDYKGIAPKAQLALMKVFTDVHKTPASDKAGSGDYGSFSEIAFLTALEDSIALKVDAINVSIGSDLADFEQGSISQRTLDKLSKAGLLSAISAGNGGKSAYAFTGGYANWTQDMVETGVMGSFANNANTMTIAAGQPVWTFYEDSLRIETADGAQVVPYQDQIVNRDGEAKDYNKEKRMVQLVTGNDDPDVDPTEEQQLTKVNYVYIKGFGESTDYTNVDVSGKVVIVNRGKIDFSTKYTNAASRGARALLIINNDPTENDFTFRCDFGDAKGSINKPVALVLYKDKPFFESNPIGAFMVKKNTSSENPLSNTMSDFSTDGGTYDLDLKPEITAPGSNIKGAVWPQNKKEKKDPFKPYEYFNGTSMSAPNYEGAMAVVTSKLAKGMVEDGWMSPLEEKQLQAFKDTINMRMMSTAIPMHDYKENDEDGKKTITSPRMQGAGMVNLDGAYNTDVYVKGSDTNKPDEALNTSKIMLRNSEAIAKGNIKLNFTLVNESNETRSFAVKYNVMRPAKALCNKVLTDDYGTPVEVSDVRSFTGWEYYAPEEHKLVIAEGTANYKDVFKVSKDIQYFLSEQEYRDNNPTGVIKEGLYYCPVEGHKDGEKIEWLEVPNYDYQSVKDVQIAEVTCVNVTVPANSSLPVSLDEYSISEADKDKIEAMYETGTYIEGYVSLTSTDGHVDLSVPYMGFYSLTDRHADYDYSTPEVVEPFEFEKDPKKIYGSDLINDVAKSLVGKDYAEFGSLMVAGYAQNPKNIDINKVVTNDTSFKRLDGFYPVGTTPSVYDYAYTETPGNDIYIGNPLKSNTLIVQQFVMRSCKDNFFTITNKKTGEEIYRNALTDMLFGTTDGKPALYKSHVDADYLGGGYVAHRAYSIIPMYDVDTKVSFASGEYELKFNYQLAATDKWVSKSYNLHIDAESPVISSILDVKENGKDMVRITYKDMRCAYALVGSNMVDVKYDEKEKVYYSLVEKSIFDSSINSNVTDFSNSRLYIKAVDYARGETLAIVHFDGNDYSHFTLAQGQGLTTTCDFTYENDSLRIVDFKADGSKVDMVNVYGYVYVSGEPVAQKDIGLILGLSIGGGVLVLGGIGVGIFFFLMKKKLFGGK